MTMPNPNFPRYVALIPAAGVGARMGAALPKQYLPLDEKTVLRHTVDAFLNFPAISQVLVVVSADDAYVDQALPAHPRLCVLRCGGATRRDTVRNGLLHWQSELDAQDWVLVHDAARPGIHALLLNKLVTEVAQHPVGGLLALPVVDTVKRAVGGRVETIAREGLWLAQTPQMFRYRLLCAALDAATQATDESSAVEAVGHTPLLVAGHACNLKITVPDDLELAQVYLSSLGSKTV